ncbi:hypothetical protein ZOSMA_76G00700 [Zostera marina]|uniref:Uncharacterized protein n=1 Tax=Zostera marina TaxID=29655 RepID=A0A0K9NP08_ZOSMR|nr:hypothetical protein ZOSMA_76G00700 [Zostera marina]
MQALGGHQNKHRVERSEIRRTRKDGKRTFQDQLRQNRLYAFPTYINDFPPYDGPRKSSFGSYGIIRGWSCPSPYHSYYSGSRQTRPNGNGATVGCNNWNMNRGNNGVDNNNRIVNAAGNENVGGDNGAEDEDVVDGLDLTLHL